MRGNRRFTDLARAARTGDIEAVRELLAAGENPHIADHRLKWTPLAFAASRGHKDVVKLLLDHSSKPTNDEINRALRAVATNEKCDKEVLKLLLAAGGDGAEP